MKRSKLTAALRSFHKDEDGIEAVQVVMIVAIAALVLIAMLKFGQEIINWSGEKFNDLKGEELNAPS